MRWNLFKYQRASHGKKEHLLYSIDTVNNIEVTGWCFDFNCPNNPIRLRFFMDDREIGETEAILFREDVKSYNLHPTGRCGFEFAMPRNILIRNHRFLSILAGPFNKSIQRISTLQLPLVMEEPLARIFFMHIPKTAGTSFNAFCRMHFPNVKTATHIESLPPSVYPDLLKEKSYLSGHLTLRHLKEGFGDFEFDLLSLVREPFAHLHSHLRWVKSIAANPKSGFFLKHHPVIQKTALKLKQLDFSDKRQLQTFARTLSGIEIDFFDNLQTRYFLDYRPEKVTRIDLTRAITNLSRFRIIGTTERYDSFIAQVCETYHMEKILPPVFNKASGTRLFRYEDPEIRRTLNPLVEFDRFLYDWIVQSSRLKEVTS